MTALTTHPAWCDQATCDGVYHSTDSVGTVASAVCEAREPQTRWHLDTAVSVRGTVTSQPVGALAVCIHLGSIDNDEPDDVIDVEVWLTPDEALQHVQDVQLVLGQLSAGESVDSPAVVESSGVNGFTPEDGAPMPVFLAADLGADDVSGGEQ